MAQTSVSSLQKQAISLTNKLGGLIKTKSAQGVDTSAAQKVYNKSVSMNTQGKAEGSKAYKGSSYEQAYNNSVIPVTALNTTTTPVTLPNIPKVTDPGAINLTGSPDLTSFGYSTKDNQFVYDPKASESENAVNQSTQNQMQLLLQSFGLQGEQGSKAGLYEDTYGVSDRQAKRDYEAGRRDVSNYTSQLNNIVAKAQAESLGLEGQGRGITESIIGGQQAQINREAAIQALPIQAQLASSQANLEEATRHLDNLFKLKSEDADAKYKRQSDMVQAVLGVASQGQQNLLTAKLADIGERKKTADANRALVNEYANMAKQSGQNNLITGFTSLDVNAPDFAQKFGAMQAKVIDTTSALQRESLRANIAQSYSAIETDRLQQQKLLAELNPSNDESVNSDLASYAQQYADTGKLPSVTELKNSNITASHVTSYAKQVPKANGVILSSNTGIKSSAISPAQEDGINALYDIKKKVADLKVLDNERQKGLLSATVGKIFGSDDQQRYMDLRGEIVDLLARARTGAALSTQEEKFYSDQLPGRIGQVGVIPGTGAGLFGVNTQERITNFETKIQGTLDTKLSGNGLVIQGYSTINVPAIGKKTVGEIIDIGGTQYRVLADGTLTDII